MSLPSFWTNPHTHSQFKITSNSTNEIHTESLPTILWILRYDCILIQQFECGRKGRRERSLRNLATSSSASWLTHSAARVSFTTSKSSFPPPLPPPALSFPLARLIRGSITHVTIAKHVRGRVGGGGGRGRPDRGRPDRGCVDGERAGNVTSGRTRCGGGGNEGALSFSREPKALTIAE